MMYVAPRSITWRASTQDELERCQVADRVNLIDGASSILVDGQLVAICDEYGTAVYAGHCYDDEDVPGAMLEAFNEAACKVAEVGVRG